MNINELISNCRLLETDHYPDGWPAIRMKDVTALCDEIERLTQERDQLNELLGIATGALGHYTYGGSDYAKIAVDALREIRQKAQEAK